LKYIELFACQTDGTIDWTKEGSTCCTQNQYLPTDCSWGRVIISNWVHISEKIN